jgi:hypothetical protein
MNPIVIKAMYNNLRNLPKADLAKMDIKKTKEKLPASVQKMDDRVVKECLIFSARVAREVSEDEFVKWVESDYTELSAIKLTQQEQELIKGGFLKAWVIGFGVGYIGVLSVVIAMAC